MRKCKRESPKATLDKLTKLHFTTNIMTFDAFVALVAFLLPFVMVVCIFSTMEHIQS